MKNNIPQRGSMKR